MMDARLQNDLAFARKYTRARAKIVLDDDGRPIIPTTNREKQIIEGAKE